MTDLKQVILIRNDIKISKGKLVTQVAHACVLASYKASPEIIKKWEEQGMTKIALGVDNITKLNNLVKEAKDKQLIALTVRDNGLTELNEGTVVCGVIGPNESDEIDKVTSKLALFH